MAFFVVIPILPSTFPNDSFVSTFLAVFSFILKLLEYTVLASLDRAVILYSTGEEG